MILRVRCLHGRKTEGKPGPPGPHNRDVPMKPQVKRSCSKGRPLRWHHSIWVCCALGHRSRLALKACEMQCRCKELQSPNFTGP